MTLPAPPLNSSRASQRTLHRLPVPALSMSLRSRRAAHPAVTLSLPQLERYHDRAEQTLIETLAAYRNVNTAVDTVDRSEWKLLQMRHGVRLFRGRRRRKTSSGPTTPVLCLGALRGRFDDLLEGLYCPTTEEMLLTNAINCPRLAESAVLYSVQSSSRCEPYAFTGVKWTTVQVAMARNRDLCYFDKMGLVRSTVGNRLAYHVMQSVDPPASRHNSSHKRVQTSLCYLFEELQDDLVAVYMQGEMDHAALSCFSTPAVSSLLLAVTNAVECTRAKKLAELLTAAAAAPAPRRYRRRTPRRRCCDVCRDSPSVFDMGRLQDCAGCNFHFVCRKCRLEENVLARDAASRSHLVRAVFCRVCIAKVDSSSIEELRADARSCAGNRQSAADRTDAFCRLETEPAGVEIPGSDRSLTAFTLKISAQVHEEDRSSHSDLCMSNLSSMEKVSRGSKDDVEGALLSEARDVLHSIKRQTPSVERMPIGKDTADTLRGSSRSTASTASSSQYYHNDVDDDLELDRTSLFARLVYVASQAEATSVFTREQSLIAASVLQRNRWHRYLHERQPGALPKL
ncbi:unnamed protein product [Hyaloperonospora brassicae]|uniref:FYVE-type domain-containing protein n=1 Tax=Hyaloperonospora brassicae TaxID=162125 RepID=A0AAV0UIV0_HYABA|nr:unnamed protein product [Hyaloperonospora brassicae]